MGLLVPRRGRRDVVQEPSFSASLLTCHHALVLLLPSLQAIISLAQEGEASLLPTPLPLPLFPVVSIFIGAFTFSKSKQAQWGSDKSGANKVAAHSARSEASFLICNTCCPGTCVVVLLAAKKNPRSGTYVSKRCVRVHYTKGKKHYCRGHPRSKSYRNGRGTQQTKS